MLPDPRHRGGKGLSVINQWMALEIPLSPV